MEPGQSADGVAPASGREQARPLSAKLVYGAAVALVATVWLSATLFGLYILGGLTFFTAKQWGPAILARVLGPS